MSTPGSGLASKMAMSPGPTIVGTQALASGQELSKDQIRLLNEQGYLSLSAITSTEEVAEIRMALQQLFDKKAGENEGANLDFVAGDDPEAPRTAPQILNPANYSPKLRKTACFKNALKIAKQALGDDARCFFDLTIMKLPHVGAATPWHQDVAFRDPRFEYSEMTVWVALQDVTVEGGCLRFLPCSNTLPVLPHHSMNDDPTSHAYECIGNFDQSAAVACPLPMGSCTIHLPGTLHSAGPNTSNTARLAYIMVFGVAPKPAKSAQDFPWLEQKQTPAQAKKKQWMRRGGVFITVWRRLRRGDLTNWQTAVYGLKRIGRILRRGE
jgi:ectoine hydroxylase-related dioxygenase (phytanoyl-CoA dioxygenase family)